MCCVLVLLAFVGPRAALVLMWLFTNYLSRAYDAFLLPFLGFLFLPWTTLAYVVAWGPLYGVSSWGWLVVALGVAADLATYTSRAAKSRYRTAY